MRSSEAWTGRNTHRCKRAAMVPALCNPAGAAATGPRAQTHIPSSCALQVTPLTALSQPPALGQAALHPQARPLG